MPNVISLNNISMRIQERFILNNISLDIQDKNITVITGHNGAGKTTLLKVMAKLLKPSNGDIHYNDTSIFAKSSFMFQKSIFLNRSVEANLAYALSCSNENNVDYKSKVLKYLHHYKLEYLYGSPAKNLSSGEQQLISFIRAIITKPRILFLDEPTSSLDSNYRNIIHEKIIQMSEYVKIIIISQSKEQIKLFTTQPIVIEKGRVK